MVRGRTRLSIPDIQFTNEGAEKSIVAPSVGSGYSPLEKLDFLEQTTHSLRNSLAPDVSSSRQKEMLTQLMEELASIRAPAQRDIHAYAEAMRRKLLFCSYCTYFDPASGAALATRDLLEVMAPKVVIRLVRADAAVSNYVHR